MLRRAVIRGLIVQALKARVTLAGDRVYENRNWPAQMGQFPLINVESPRERKESLGRASPSFTTTGSFMVGAEVQAITYQDASAQLDAIAEQIQRAVINYTPLMQQIQQIASVETQQEIRADGEVHQGFILLNLGIEFYEGDEDFYDIPTDPLEQVALEICTAEQTTAPGLCLQLQQET